MASALVRAGPAILIGTLLQFEEFTAPAPSYCSLEEGRHTAALFQWKYTACTHICVCVRAGGMCARACVCVNLAVYVQMKI